MSQRPALLSAHGLSRSFGPRPLFADLAFGLHERDHVVLVGRNGCGKSTLLRILAGVDEPDAGEVALQRGSTLGYVPQEPTFPAGATVQQVLEGALTDLPLDLAEIAARVAETLGRSGFEDPARSVDTLSGGWRKRLAIAREWVREPDVLLLDEPTNHLDLESILWLEELLRQHARAFVLVSHDRAFIERVATRVVELDRAYPDGLLSVEGSYVDFLEKRAEVHASQSALQDALSNRVRREIEWLRRGPQGRQAKQKARIQEAGGLIEELADMKARGPQGTAGITFSASERRTRKLVEGKGLTKAYGDRVLFRDLDLTLSPGTRLGLLGTNGTGKTTLLRLLEGKLEPDSGTIQRADALRVVHFTQDRSALDPTWTLRRALAPAGGDTVIYGDRPMHVAAWAKRFLFPAEHLELPVGRLSGGEQARVLIARLMLEPADVLILDEPTNDLDIPTLEVLEEAFEEFPGALVLVTHDRFLLDRVSTEILALDGAGGARLVADLDQALAFREAAQKPAVADRPVERKPAERKASAPRKLSYREQKELEGMEETILLAEEHLATCQQAVEDPAVASDAWELQRRCEALETAQHEVERLYARWSELELKVAEFAAQG
ncbi:MAG: ABC-F family ATP-binding cassette domain-containing protein [bacterium]|nr:ABC-F family ATP-binding cassette domain-containing protein [bacterium]